MAVHVCSNCGHVEHIFGADGGKKMAAGYGMDYLGALPLALHIREQADSGRPTVIADPESEVAGLYKGIGPPGCCEDCGTVQRLLQQVPDHRRRRSG